MVYLLKIVLKYLEYFEVQDCEDKKDPIINNALSLDKDIEFEDKFIPQDSVKSQIYSSPSLDILESGGIASKNKLDDGEIYSNDFKVTGEETLTIKDVNYPCYVVLRETENRTTRYYFAKNLDFILLKVDDKRPSRRTSIDPVKILSFG